MRKQTVSKGTAPEAATTFPKRIPFRVSDYASHTRRTNNEAEVAVASIRKGLEVRSMLACGLCAAEGVTRFKALHQLYVHELAGENAVCECRKCKRRSLYKAANAMLAVREVPPGDDEENTLLVAKLARGMDVPAKMRHAVPGPVMTFGGTVYLTGHKLPVYPTAIDPSVRASDDDREWFREYAIYARDHATLNVEVGDDDPPAEPQRPPVHVRPKFRIKGGRFVREDGGK